MRWLRFGQSSDPYFRNLPRAFHREDNSEFEHGRLNLELTCVITDNNGVRTTVLRQPTTP